MPKVLKSCFTIALFLLFFTKPGFTQSWPAFLLYQKDGAVAGDSLGWWRSVAGVGDVDGDGRDDFIVGTPGADPAGLSEAGSAYLYSGADGSLLFQKDGAASGDRLGISVAGAGDVNGDGRADFIIGAYGADLGTFTDAGSAFVYSGADGSPLFQKDGAAAGDWLGWSVAGVGDVNGDGRDDFIVGAPTNPSEHIRTGSAYLYSGADGTLLLQKDGAGAGYAFGFVVAGAGDVDGDGGADFIVSAVHANLCGFDCGSIYVYSGASGLPLFQKNGSTGFENFGGSVAGAGDVNGDGRADFLVGASTDPGGRVDASSVYVYSGLDGSVLYQKDGAAALDFASSVAGAGDVNGDGRPDFIVGAPGADPGGLSEAGTAYLYSGADGSPLFQKDGAAAGDWLGWSVAGVGDVDGDGKNDFIIGAPFADPGGLDAAGSTFVFHSGYSERIFTVADVPNDQGKMVQISWKSLPGGDAFVQNFVIYRRVGAALARGGNPQGAANTPLATFDSVTSIPAVGDTLYSATVPTLQDSTTTNGMHWSVFYVSAVGANPADHFDSPVDSGYSVDNLVPSAPSVLAATGTCQGNRLSYSPPVDADFQYFKIYRDTSASFSSPVAVGNTIDTFFVDVAPVSKTFYYRVRAVDFSGNEGNFSPQANALAGLKGDLNVDALLTAPDVVMLLNAAFLGSSFPAPFCAADVYCDGVLTAVDVVIELNMVFLGLPVICTP